MKHAASDCVRDAVTTPPKRRRTHVRASERPPPTPSMEERIAALEAAVEDLKYWRVFGDREDR